MKAGLNIASFLFLLLILLRLIFFIANENEQKDISAAITNVDSNSSSVKKLVSVIADSTSVQYQIKKEALKIQLAEITRRLLSNFQSSDTKNKTLEFYQNGIAVFDNEVKILDSSMSSQDSIDLVFKNREQYFRNYTKKLLTELTGTKQYSRRISREGIVEILLVIVSGVIVFSKIKYNKKSE